MSRAVGSVRHDFAQESPQGTPKRILGCAVGGRYRNFSFSFFFFSLLLQSIGLVVNLPARGVDSYYMTSPLIGRGPRAWPGRRGAPFPSSLGPSAPSFPGFRPFRVPQLAPRGQSGSGFPGFRPFHLSQLAPTCGPAAVLRRASLHDEDVQLRSQTPRLAPPRARIPHRSGSGSRHSAE